MISVSKLFGQIFHFSHVWISLCLLAVPSTLIQKKQRIATIKDRVKFRNAASFKKYKI